MILINPDKSLMILDREKPRSKRLVLVCFGRKRHYHRDGGCKHTIQTMAKLRPEIRSRVRVEPFGGKR